MVDKNSLTVRIMYFRREYLKRTKPQDVVGQKYLTTICCIEYILLP